MPNPLRGEASFKAGTDTYTLVFDVNVFCEIEADTGLGVNALIVEVQGNPSFRMLRSIICGALQPKHDNMTALRAGEIMSDAGLHVVMESLKKAMAQALPAPKKKAGSENPPKAATERGTG